MSGTKKHQVLCAGLDSEQRRSLGERQRLFQELTRRLFEFTEQDPRLSAEILPASKYFFHGHNPLPHVQNEQDSRLAFGRCTEWFAYERVSRGYRQRPIETFMARLPDGDERRFAEQMTRNVLDSFAVRAVAPGRGITLQSLTSQRVFDVFEHSASQQLVCGAVLMGRLFPLDEQFWTLSGVMLSLNDARAAEHLARDLSRLDPEARGVRSQRDYEAAIMGEADKAVTFEEKEQLPADQIEARVRTLLAEAGITADIASLRRRMSCAEYPLDVAEGVLKKGRFVNEEHMEELFAALMELWNTTARPGLDGRTPREANKLAPVGPMELRLAGEFAESLRREGFPDRFGKDRKRRRAAIAARQHEWMNTPRDDLDGVSPAEVVAAERAQSMESATPPGEAPTVYKVSRNAPCPCGSGKRYKRCCLPRQH
jgi:hypothetical protein